MLTEIRAPRDGKSRKRKNLIDFVRCFYTIWMRLFIFAQSQITVNMTNKEANWERVERLLLPCWENIYSFRYLCFYSLLLLLLMLLLIVVIGVVAICFIVDVVGSSLENR